MIFNDDVEPPHKPCGNDKTNSYIQLSKIKNHLNKVSGKLANAKMLAATMIKATAIFCGRRLKLAKRLIRKNNIADYLPHAIVCVLTLIVVGSNFVISARANNTDSLVAAEPDQEINVAASVESYTPLLPDSHLAVEKAYLASNQEFTEVKTTVDTQITAREDPLPDNSAGTVYYVVRAGDTLTGLGWKFGVKLASLKYVNDMAGTDVIKPGQRLKVPKAGYVVPESVLAAAEKKKLAAANRSTTYRSSSSSRTSGTVIAHAAGSRANGYPYGYCTYYVATRRAMPTSMGNARSWLSSARGRGMSTGSSPAPGAIVVTSESWYGHVAYVESVNGSSFTIAEMNYAGWGVVSRRTISTGSGVVRGFIY